MQDLNLLEIINYTFNTLKNSQVLILLILEILILLVSLIFKNIMSKTIVKRTSIIASIIIFTFYISNYINTIITFMNNVSTKLVEFIYFPTTLEYIVIMLISFGIMFYSLLNKKTNIIVKIMNTVLPIFISFIFLAIIEYINTNNIPFNEFSVFTNSILTSLYEFGVCVFIIWLTILLIIKVDQIVLDHLAKKGESIKLADLITVNIPDVHETNDFSDIELPKLKEN